jgi:mRNA interferase RelE/StbE
MYKIEILSSADRALRKINLSERATIAKRINKLSENPRPYGYKKLENNDLYRIRVGDYRVIYQIHDNDLLILIVRIGHRREIYRR